MLLRIRRALARVGLCGSDIGGSVLPLAAAALPVIILLVGGGLDASRAYETKSRLQYACDAGVLAGRKAAGDTGEDADNDDLPDTAEAAAAKYFDANFDEDLQSASSTTFSVTTPDSGNTVSGTASTELDPVMMQVFGMGAFELQTSCSASMAMGNSDVAMVLDVTGSMSCTAAMSESQCGSYIGTYGYSETAHGKSSRLNDLRLAMKDFFDTVDQASQGTNARIRYAFVPYSSTVNVGGLLNPDWLVDSMTIPSRKAVYQQVASTGWDDPVSSTGTAYSGITYGSWKTVGGSYSSQSNCLKALPTNLPYTNQGSPYDEGTDTVINASGQRVTTQTTTQDQRAVEYQCVKSGGKYYLQTRNVDRKYYVYDIETQDPITIWTSVFKNWSYENVLYDTSQFKLGNTIALAQGSNGANKNFTWNGCIIERATVNSGSISYNSLLGMSPSGLKDLDVDLIPDPSDPTTQWRPMFTGLAYRRTSNGNMTNASPTTSGSVASVYCPHASQTLAEMDQDGFYNFANALKPTGSTYHDIGMIWGGRMLSSEGVFGDIVDEAPDNAASVAKHLIFMTDGQMAPDNDIYSAYGVEFHERRVSSDGSSNLGARHLSRFSAMCSAIKAKGIRIWVIAFSTGLSTDMSNCASTDSAFTASNATQLNEAFQEIAKDVGELRITQ